MMQVNTYKQVANYTLQITGFVAVVSDIFCCVYVIIFNFGCSRTGVLCIYHFVL